MTIESKVWFITGASRGFGRLWAVAALERGDRVAATARDTDALNELVEVSGDAVLPIELNVTDREACIAAVNLAHAHFGRLDVVVNNAGYGQLGFVEEVSEQQTRDQFETNVFGALRITQAVLPLMRGQRCGHIIQVSSIGGITSFAGGGIYSASKWALEGFSQALAWEVAPLGIRVTLVEPGSFATGWRDSTQQATLLDDYGQLHELAAQAVSEKLASRHDPKAAASALLEIVDAPIAPLRVFLGADALGLAKDDYDKRLDTWEQWQPFAVRTGG